MNLRSIDGWAFDLDGVIWHGQEVLNGAPELIRALRQAGRRVVFLTNNSAQSTATLVARLAALGIPAAEHEVVSAVSAAGQYLKDRHGTVRVLPAGSVALTALLQEAGHRVVSDPMDAEAVVLGRDAGWDYDKLTAVCRAVERGVPFLAINLDMRFPVEGGKWLPGCGALAASVSAVTGRAPEVIGKPSPLLFQAALKQLGTAPEKSLMAGDTPSVDIAGALQMQMWTVLVGQATGGPNAHLRVTDPAELLRLWQASHA